MSITSNATDTEVVRTGPIVVSPTPSKQYIDAVTRPDPSETERRPVRQQGSDREPMLNRWRHLPYVDPDKMRRDIDQIIDPSL